MASAEGRTIRALGREPTPENIGNIGRISVLGSCRQYFRAGNGGGRRNRAGTPTTPRVMRYRFTQVRVRSQAAWERLR